MLFSSRFVPCSVLSAPCKLSHLTYTNNYEVRTRISFLDEEIEAERG